MSEVGEPLTIDLSQNGPMHFTATYVVTIDETAEEALLRVSLPGGKVHITVTVEGARLKTPPHT